MNSQAQQAESRQQTSQIKRCAHCGAALDDDVLFCPECGEKIGGEQRVCPICKYSTTSEYCPHCGYKIVPTICPNCKTESHYDFCENCGTILNKELEEHLRYVDSVEKPRQMTEEETREIDRAIDASKTPELKAFLKKVEEHQILLEERDYFKKREKRIVNVFGKGPVEFELPDPEEQAFMMKAYASLEKIVIERQKKALKEELEKLFPDMPEEEIIDIVEEDPVAEAERQRKEEERQRQEAERLAELERQQKEMEQRYKETMAKISAEFKTAQEHEKARLEEIRRKQEEERRKQEEERKRIEAEQRRLEEERKKREAEKRRLEEIARAKQQAEENKILGTYTGRPAGKGKTEYFCINYRSGSRISGYLRTRWDEYTGYDYEYFSGTIYGKTVQVGVDSWAFCTRPNLQPFSSFYGTIDDDGTYISGCWSYSLGSQYTSYYKY